MLACSSPRLFAACHVLRRRFVPRHPPCALIRLTEAPPAAAIAAAGSPSSPPKVALLVNEHPRLNNAPRPRDKSHAHGPPKVSNTLPSPGNHPRAQGPPGRACGRCQTALQTSGGARKLNRAFQEGQRRDGARAAIAPRTHVIPQEPRECCGRIKVEVGREKDLRVPSHIPPASRKEASSAAVTWKSPSWLPASGVCQSEPPVTSSPAVRAVRSRRAI